MLFSKNALEQEVISTHLLEIEQKLTYEISHLNQIHTPHILMVVSQKWPF